MTESLAARAAVLSAIKVPTDKLLNLEQQKKRAKELLKAAQAGDPEALTQFRGQTPILANAQHAVARSLGFAKWEGLKAHTARARVEREALQSGTPSVPDSDAQTLHIRCGSDTRDGLAIAGFRGDFLSFAYPFVHGPAPKSNFLDVAAEFLASVEFTQSKEAARARLASEFDSLNKASDYDRVCFWFEHDSYDQLCLIFLLDWFAKANRRPKQVDLICVDGYPGFKKFHGIGQLAPDAFRVLWQSRRPVTIEQYSLGQRAWQALIEPSPMALFELATGGTPAVPTMAPAVLRQLQELPARANGFSLTEQLALTILQGEGPLTAGRLFNRYTNHYEPLVFMGDLGFYNLVLRPLASGPDPAIILNETPDERERWRETVEPTPLAAELLAGRKNWLDHAPVHRWVGGVEIRSGTPAWCWDTQNQHPVLRE